MSFYLVIYFFLSDTDVIMILLQFCLLHYASTRITDASIDQWHSGLKTWTCAADGHFKHTE